MNRSKEILRIARVCHETNRAYCRTIGDESQPTWESAPDWQKESAIDGVIFHFEKLDQGQEVSPIDSHNSWLEEKTKNGWKYGPVKDPDKKEHPCFVPFSELPVEQRMKDYLFGAVVKAYYLGSQ